jgi:putative ABC transport system permease protein
MRQRHNIPEGGEDDFSVRGLDEIAGALTQTTDTMTYLLAGIAAVSLLVGGIGIMNIMLVSVTERTREIGLRKAVGATRGDILLQFMVEALALCLTGGLFGILLGTGAALALSRFMQWNTLVDPLAVAVAFGFSALVGLFFGIWPARRAARLDPITALRYE